VFANSLFANTAPDPLAPRTNTTHTNEQVFANVFANVSERRTLNSVNSYAWKFPCCTIMHARSTAVLLV